MLNEQYGLCDWIASSPEEYVRIAIAKAKDPRALSVLRGQMRGRLAASELGNPDQFARTTERAYDTMWRKWCRG